MCEFCDEIIKDGGADAEEIERLKRLTDTIKSITKEEEKKATDKVKSRITAFVEANGYSKETEGLGVIIAAYEMGRINSTTAISSMFALVASGVADEK